MPQIFFQVIFKENAIFPSVLIPNKHTDELKINVIPMSRKLQISCFMDFYVPTKILGEVGEKYPL